jgi:hypothetical protein
VDLLGQPQQPADIGELEQDVRRVAAEPEACQPRAEPVDVIERDLAAPADVDRDAGLVELRAKLGHQELHRLGGRRPVIAHVRSRREHAHPVGDGGSRHVEAVLDRRRTVVDAGEDMRVQIDHPAPYRIG